MIEKELSSVFSILAILGMNCMIIIMGLYIHKIVYDDLIIVVLF